VSSDAELKRWYRTFRHRFFTNKLPEAKEIEIFYDDMPGLQAECDDLDMPHNEDFIVRINRIWKDHPEIAKLWLFHEMAHMHLWPYSDHGKPFQDEMKRLALADAFKRIW
jgi:hypothetical protein